MEEEVWNQFHWNVLTTSIMLERVWRSTPEEIYEGRKGTDCSREIMDLINTMRWPSCQYYRRLKDWSSLNMLCTGWKYCWRQLEMRLSNIIWRIFHTVIEMEALCRKIREICNDLNHHSPLKVFYGSRIRSNREKVNLFAADISLTQWRESW